MKPQPHFPFEFWQENALDVLENMEQGTHRFDAIHASPPCQHYTAGRRSQRLAGNNPYPDLIGPVRELLEKTGRPWIIENVVGAPLHSPVMLCGQMFGLRVLRHRLFESNIALTALQHEKHTGSMLDGSIIAVYGNKRIVSGGARKDRDEKYANYGSIPLEFRRVEAWREAMEIDWMTGRELKEAIPPRYTEYLGRQIMAVL